MWNLAISVRPCQTLALCALILCFGNQGFAGVMATGTPGDLAALTTILSAETGTTVSINAQGMLEIAAGGNACAERFRLRFNSVTMITLNVGRNLSSPDGKAVLIGGFRAGANGVSTGTQDLDLDDVEQLGTDAGSGNMTRGGSILHEIVEAQLSIALGIGYHDTATSYGAHTFGIAAENDYHSGMSQTPTLRVCDETEERRVDTGPGVFKIYFRSWKQTNPPIKGWSCIPCSGTCVGGTHKAGVTSPPTFVEGENLPPGLAFGATCPTLAPGPVWEMICPAPPAVPAMPAISTAGLVTSAILMATLIWILVKRLEGPSTV